MKKSAAEKLLKLNYDLYEYHTQSFSNTRKEMWEKEVLDFVTEIPAYSKVLDLGCGNGRLYENILQNKYFAKNCYRNKLQSKIRYLGIDSSKEFIKKNQTLYGRGLFKAGNGLTMKFNNKFDFLISIAVLHHIPSEKLQLIFLKNIHQALRPKGKVLISVWNRWQTKYEKYFIFENPKLEIRNSKQIQNPNVQIDFRDLNQNDTIVPWKQSGYFRYIHAYKPDELKSLAQKAGFKNVQCFASKHGIKTSLSNALNIYLIGEK